MQKYFFKTLVLLTLILFSCHNKAMDQSIKKTPVAAVSEPDKSVAIDPQADMTTTGASYQVDSMTVNGNTLSIFINYSGGCKPHVFDLVSNGMYAKSMPPQISVCLKHTNNGDACRELVMRELKFDISKLKRAGSNTVAVKLGDKQVNYSTK